MLHPAAKGHHKAASVFTSESARNNPTISVPAAPTNPPAKPVNVLIASISSL